MAANGAAGTSFNDRFPAPRFADRFPTPRRELCAASTGRGYREAVNRGRAGPLSGSILGADRPRPAARGQRRPDHAGQPEILAFPYLGNNPSTDQPFLNILKGERRGHRSYSGRVYWQDETYSDNRVLMHVPEHFDIHRPGVIVVLFPGNGATLIRDVRDRQLVPQQITESGANACCWRRNWPSMPPIPAPASSGKLAD